jgi:hybrid polyketide synthase/nonribosomal peptide synthetase ACE1
LNAVRKLTVDLYISLVSFLKAVHHFYSKMTAFPLTSEPIAIIGSGCRLPGEASTPSRLWDLLRQPRDLLSKIPEDRFNPNGFYHPDPLHHATTNVTESYMLSENPRVFDAKFFNIKPVEAHAIDPQQRILLEIVYESLESAGLAIEQLGGSKTGVFVGLMCEDYGNHIRRDPDFVPMYTATGIASSLISNRISYFFDWHGPSITLDTACSSSLVAIHQAVQSLRNGESKLAVAAGANLILTPDLYVAESKLNMLSPNSRSRMWDINADGYARGEGIAAVVLKPLRAALQDGDHIECVIRETGINQDGRTQGITAPNSSAQAQLIRDTYAKSGLDATKKSDRCQYFEAHGTGTPIGEPQEARAISEAFFEAGNNIQQRDDILYVGSIKTVIGHTEGTAGISGLLKVSLAMQNKTVPPNMLFTKLNPSIEPFYHNLEVPVQAIPWPAVPDGQPMRASVNGFGFGGTNAHVILESFEHTRFPVVHAPPIPLYLPFTFSAASERSLIAMLTEYSTFLQKNENLNFQDLSYTLNSRRSNLPLRLALSASSISGLRSEIDAKLEAIRTCATTSLGVRSTLKTHRILGVFTGQGAQWALMGKLLILGSPSVLKCVEGFDHTLAQLPAAYRPSWSIKDELLAGPSNSRIHEAEISQPVCTVVQIILVNLLHAAGIHFEAVVGHSSGEIACAYAAGFITEQDAIKIAYCRGLNVMMMNRGHKIAGAMLAVGISLEEGKVLCELPEFKSRICVAASNSPSNITLSGDADAIRAMKAVLDQQGKFSRLLKVDNAYHSHYMAPCFEPYINCMRVAGIEASLQMNGPCYWFSSVYDGELMNERDELKDFYWAENMLKPVLFSHAISAAFKEKGSFDMILEVGPHPALKGPVLQTIQDHSKEVIPYSGLLNRGKDDTKSVTDALNFVWTHCGNPAVDFKSYKEFILGSTTPTLVKGLPNYPWDHEGEYWIETRTSKAFRSRIEPIHELLGIQRTDTPDELRWKNILLQKEIPWLSHHKLQGQPVLPAAAYVSTALEAAKYLAAGQEVQLIELHNLVIGQAITFDENDDSGVEIMIALTKVTSKDLGDKVIVVDFKYYSSTSCESEMILNASGRIQVTLGEATDTMLLSRSPPAPHMVELDQDLFYSSLEDIGYGYTGPFRALSSMKRALGHGTAMVSNPACDEAERSLLIHPAMLDAAIHSTFLALCWPEDGSLRSLHVPIKIRRVSVNPLLCKLNLNHETQVPLDSCITDFASAEIQGDIEIFPVDVDHAMIQIEGVSVVPFATYGAVNDRQLFSTWEWNVASPDGERASNNSRASAEEYEVASISEQAAIYYLKTLRETFKPEDILCSEWHHKRIFDFADHILSRVESGKQPFSQKGWIENTKEDIYKLMEKFVKVIMI